LNEQLIQKESTTNKPLKYHIVKPRKTFQTTLLFLDLKKKKGDEAKIGKCQKQGPSLVKDEKQSKKRI
jgi:hypothetical protein